MQRRKEDFVQPSPELLGFDRPLYLAIGRRGPCGQGACRSLESRDNDEIGINLQRIPRPDIHRFGFSAVTHPRIIAPTLALPDSER